VKAAIEKTAATFGGLDIVVNNASAVSRTTVAETDMKRFDLMHQINTRGTFMVSKYAIPHLANAANPHILMNSPPLDMQEKWFAGSTAYSIAKYRQGKIGMLILLARMTPFVSYLLPWYIIFRYLKLIDTYTALTLTHLIITLPMVAWLMVAFFESVPAELEDAAMIDGCSRWQSFMRIVLPLVRNGIATSAIMSFIFSWNNFMFALVLSGANTKTLPVAIFNFVSYASIDWGSLMSAAVIVTVPIMVIALFTQKYVVSGLTAGATKG